MRVSENGKSLCHEAREYYYDLLCGEGAGVPDAIVRHVEECSFCREQIRGLQEAVSWAESRSGPPDQPGDGETTELLSRQFEFVGERVACSHVRPFLPDLLIPSRRIRIPTPITVHMEHCPHCRTDLASIRALGLTVGQLKRLSLFYGRSSAGGQPSIGCLFLRRDRVPPRRHSPMP